MRSCSVDMTVKCTLPYSKEYQNGGFGGGAAPRRPPQMLVALPQGAAAAAPRPAAPGMRKRRATATPHSPPESLPARNEVGQPQLLTSQPQH